MPSLILPSRFNQQPQQAVQVDWSNPLAQGLICVFVGSSPFDPVTGKPFVDTLFNSGTPNRVVTGSGVGVDGRLGMAKAIINGPSVTVGSLFGLVIANDSSNEQCFVEIGPDGSYAEGVRGLRMNGGAISTYERNFAEIHAPTSYPLNVPLAVGASYNADATALYVGGVLVASGSTRTSTSTAVMMNVAGITGAGQNYNLRGQVPVAMAWSRVLRPDEMASLAANPWQVLKAPPRRFFAAPAAAAISGSAAMSERADTATGSGAVSNPTITGTALTAEGSDSGAASGSVTYPAITGSAASAEGGDTAVAAGTIGNAISGSMSAAEAPDTASSAGAVAWPPLSGTASPSEPGDTASGSGALAYPALSGSMASAESVDRLTAAGAVFAAITGAMQATEQPDTLAASSAAPAPPIVDGSGGNVRDVRAFAREIDRAERADRLTKGQRKARRRVLEAEALKLLPDEPAARHAAPIIAQMVVRQPEAVQGWAPVFGPRPVVLPPAMQQALHEQVARWMAEEAIEDEFETELLLLE